MRPPSSVPTAQVRVYIRRKTGVERGEHGQRDIRWEAKSPSSLSGPPGPELGSTRQSCRPWVQCPSWTRTYRATVNIKLKQQPEHSKRSGTQASVIIIYKPLAWPLTWLFVRHPRRVILTTSGALSRALLV